MGAYCCCTTTRTAASGPRSGGSLEGRSTPWRRCASCAENSVRRTGPSITRADGRPLPQAAGRGAVLRGHVPAPLRWLVRRNCPWSPAVRLVATGRAATAADRARGSTNSVRYRRAVMLLFKNERLNHAGYLWAFSALRASPGDMAHYRHRRDEHGDWHAAAQRNPFVSVRMNLMSSPSSSACTISPTANPASSMWVLATNGHRSSSSGGPPLRCSTARHRSVYSSWSTSFPAAQARSATR
jgi:hypothetical protein